MVDGGIIWVGGVGTGRIFQFAHSRTYPQFIEKAWLTRFYDLNPVTAQAALDQYTGLLKAYAADHPLHAERVARNLDELRCYPALDALLEEVDVVDIATHARGRMATAIAALEKGVHVMVEKPMAHLDRRRSRRAREYCLSPGPVSAQR